FGWGLGLSALLAGAMLASPRSTAGRFLEAASRLLRPLGAMSYSLYVLHLPWILFLAGWWIAGPRMLPLGPELMVLGIASSVLLAGVCWLAVERHFVSNRRGQ